MGKNLRTGTTRGLWRDHAHLPRGSRGVCKGGGPTGEPLRCTAGLPLMAWVGRRLRWREANPNRLTVSREATSVEGVRG